MSKYIIQGGSSLDGEISVSGAKNAAMKMMAAALLTNEEVVIRNVPKIEDILTMKKILENLGAKITFSGHEMSINCQSVNSFKPDYQLVKHMRGSVIIIGPLLSRIRMAEIPQPGGCLIGSRPINTHTTALKQLGVTVTEIGDLFKFNAAKFKAGKVILDEMSVTATENVMLASVLLPGKTEIHLAASEPEIVALAEMLNSMGAKILGAGTSKIIIEGVSKLHGCETLVPPDRIEAGTLIIAAAVSRGHVIVNNLNADHIEFVLKKLLEAKVNLKILKNGNSIEVLPTTIFNSINIDTRPYPGFPTDLQAPLSVLLTQGDGSGKIFETMYEGRFGYVRELQKMGANINIIDSHTINITGPSVLYGKEITTLDLRAGATLIIAALIAKGESIISKVEIIDRGYEDIHHRLNNIGADIKRVV